MLLKVLMLPVFLLLLPTVSEAHTKILCSSIRLDAQQQFASCEGRTNTKAAYLRVRTSDNPERSNPNIMKGSMPPVNEMARARAGGEIKVLWSLNKHPGDRGGVAFFRDPDLKPYTNNKPLPKWNDWSIDITPGRHAWPRNWLASFPYRDNVKYQNGYVFQPSTTQADTCPGWSENGPKPLDKFLTTLTKQGIGIGEHKVCFNTIRLPNDMNPGINRIRYHMYNYENESHWNEIFFIYIEPGVGQSRLPAPPNIITTIPGQRDNGVERISSDAANDRRWADPDASQEFVDSQSFPVDIFQPIQPPTLDTDFYDSQQTTHNRMQSLIHRFNWGIKQLDQQVRQMDQELNGEGFTLNEEQTETESQAKAEAEEETELETEREIESLTERPRKTVNLFMVLGRT